MMRYIYTFLLCCMLAVSGTLFSSCEDMENEPPGITDGYLRMG